MARVIGVAARTSVLRGSLRRNARAPPFHEWFKLRRLGGAAALVVITSFSQDLGSDLPRAAELGLYIVIAFAIFLC